MIDQSILPDFPRGPQFDGKGRLILYSGQGSWSATIDGGRTRQGRLNEIVKNLHRRTISEIERAELMARWVKIAANRKWPEPPSCAKPVLAGEVGLDMTCDEHQPL
ncbi:MAG: hypothetical protein JJU15_06365 [Pararhodobacter sp.]|nr:hypothetical protein [Pararhodobacter sp.]